MQYVSDLHLHSKYSRAVSSSMELSTMARFARQKGIDILTTGDWTHGLWFKEITNQLEEAGDGIYKLKSHPPAGGSKSKSSIQNSKEEKDVLFILSTEIASIYSQGGKLRRIHNLVFAPNLEIAAKINKELTRRGCNLLSDGRPIIGLSSKDLLELVLSVDAKCLLIPCHVWTPHFGVYGSASGFDSLEEAFGELSSNIYGIETGLSSDPEMNWQIGELKSRSILSFSDAHSPAKMGREATVFELEKPNYENLRRAIMRFDQIQDDRGLKMEDSILKIDSRSSINHLRSNRIVYTIEFYPEEGKYHFSGHRNCKVVFGPLEIKKGGNICPVCKRKLTEGVLYRLEQLSEREVKAGEKLNDYGLKWLTDPTRTHPPFVKLVPLLEIIAEALESSVSSQKVKTLFDSLCDAFGSEIEILLKVSQSEIAKQAGEKVAEALVKVRRGDIVIHPGYDGEYGKVKIWSKEHVEPARTDEEKSQLSLL